MITRTPGELFTKAGQAALPVLVFLCAGLFHTVANASEVEHDGSLQLLLPELIEADRARRRARAEPNSGAASDGTR